MNLRRSIFVSVTAHVAVLVTGLIGLPWSSHKRPDPPLTVEWIQVAEIPEEPEEEVEPEPVFPPETKPEPEPMFPPETKPDPRPPEPEPPEPKPDPRPPEPKPKPKPEPEPPEPKIEPDKPPDQMPEPEVIPPAEEEPEPEPEEETIPPPEEKAAEPEPPPVPQKRAAVRSALLDEIAAVLDELPVQKPSRAEVGTLNAADRERLELLFNRQIRKCWFLSPEMQDSGRTVRMRIWLRKDGSLARRPELLASDSELRQNRRYRSMTDSARRAVLNCAPFEIPEELFLSEFIFNFTTDGLN